MDGDVVVVGAGLSGLVAAAELVQAGRRVVVLDGEPASGLGGQAHWSFGGLFMVDSPEQRRLGVRDSPELALADWLGSAAFDRAEDHWPRRWAQADVDFAAGEQRRWLHGLGVGWFPLVQWAERGGYLAPGHGNTVPRFHVTWGTGPGLLEPFVHVLATSPRVTVRHRHKVTDLRADPSGVTVSRAVLPPSTGPRSAPSATEGVGTFSLEADAVVVATGGIGGNLDPVRRCWPSDWGRAPQQLVAGVPAHVDGSGLLAAQRAGGRVINPDRMWHYPEGVVNHTPVWPGHGVRILPGRRHSGWTPAAGGCPPRCSRGSTRWGRCGTCAPAATTGPGSCWTNRR